ncbi:MAG: IS30 family transposase [Bacteriovoracia bacterium]
MPKYRRVTYVDRCQIHSLLQNDFKLIEIAKILGFHKSTICREIARNKTGKIYNPDKAHTLAKKKKKQCRRRCKIEPSLHEEIKNKLKKTWSPEQISGRLKIEKKISVSTPTVYRLVNRFEHFRCHLKMYKRRGAGRYLQRRSRPKWESSIDSRPHIANDRKRIGDWERDTMHVKGGMTLVCTDRKSRFSLMDKVNKRTAEAVAKQTMALLKEKRAYTVTNDNGPEFRGSINIGIPVYYCTPMKPQQRGTVENTIGQIRRFIPRNTEINSITSKDLKKVQEILNNKPRKCLGFKTPYEIFYKTKKLHWKF